MSTNDFTLLVNEAVAGHQSGWDFSFVDGRMTEAPLPWDFIRLANERLGKAKAVLDQQTGGGELLSGYDRVPDVMFATETYKPNLSLARARLQPFGVQVVSEDSQLPDHTFDLVLNRHGSFQTEQLRRVSTPGAIFLTQQVGAANLMGLNRALGAVSDAVDWYADLASKQLKAAGYEIIQCLEAKPQTRFLDIGAVVFYLDMVPWQIPGFTVEGYLGPLQELHQHIERHGSFDTMAHRFLIEAVSQQ